MAYPGGIHNHFNDARKHLPEKTRELGTDDVGFTQAVVDELRKEYNIGRIFACGYSNGGQMVLRLLFDAPGLLSGAAVFAATLAACENLAPTNPIEAYQPTPLLMIHGTLDDKAPYEGGMLVFTPSAPAAKCFPHLLPASSLLSAMTPAPQKSPTPTQTWKSPPGRVTTALSCGPSKTWACCALWKRTRPPLGKEH